jgi:membrane-associated phospholipid phosphatase
MEKFFAKGITYIFHPLLMPTLGILIIFNSIEYMIYVPYEMKRAVFLIVFISTCLLPLSFIPFFYFQKIIKDFEMSSNKERFIPLFLSAIFYYIGYYLISKFTIPSVLASFMFSSVIILFLILIINLKFKISIHMSGIGGITGLIMAILIKTGDLNFYLFIVSIMVAGFVGYSRLWLKAHTQSQVYAGFAIGFAGVFLTILLH